MFAGLLLEDVRGQDQSRGLAAQAAVALGGARYAQQQLAEIVDAQVGFRDADGLQAFGQEAPGKRDAHIEIVRGRQRRIALANLAAEAFDDLGDLDQMDIPLFRGQGHEPQFVLAHPLPDQGVQLGFAQNQAGHAVQVRERALHAADVPTGQGRVGAVGIPLALCVDAGIKVRHHALESGHAQVQQVVHQPSQHPLVQIGIDLGEQIQKGAPFGFGDERGGLWIGLAPAAHQQRGQFHKFARFQVEAVFAIAGGALAEGDLQRARRLVFEGDAGVQGPRAGGKPWGFALFAAQGDAHPAEIGRRSIGMGQGAG